MSRLAWIFTLAVLAVATGGSVYYYVQHQRSEAPAAIAPVAPEPPVTPLPPTRDEEMQRRKLEGIGSTKNLKPVPIPQGNAR